MTVTFRDKEARDGRLWFLISSTLPLFLFVLRFKDDENGIQNRLGVLFVAISSVPYVAIELNLLFCKFISIRENVDNFQLVE